MKAQVALLAVSSLMVTSPAAAQHMYMPGMAVPGMKMPAPAKPKPTKKSVAKKPTKRSSGASKRSGKKAAPKPKSAIRSTDPSSTRHEQMAPEMPMPMPMPAQPHAMPEAMDHSAMDHSAMDRGTATASMTGMDHGEMAGHDLMAMTGVLGAYPMTREASGTAWQPDNGEHMGAMTTSDGWTLMAHGVVNLVADHQGSARGDDKLFASGMVMGMARRPLGNGTLQFRAGLSPDPLMGRRGYPLLLASGETANGTDRLIDRQHPHDLFMELSASVSQNIGRRGSLFLYGGLPGEPAFGPPAFMHREAIMDSPEAPITHHWLDSTHITFGVLTAGFVADRVKVEVSRFNAREPDQHRWNIETGPLDSTAVRLSWNPTDALSLQGSWGKFKDPEQLERGVDQRRWSASLLYAQELSPGWKMAGTLAWGRKTVLDRGDALRDDAFVAEASLKHRQWTVFARGEMTENRELLADVEHGPAYRVGKVSLGAVRDVPIAEHWSIGAGGLVSLNFIPKPLASLYGSRNPVGAMGFVRLKLQ